MVWHYLPPATEFFFSEFLYKPGEYFGAIYRNCLHS